MHLIYTHPSIGQPRPPISHPVSSIPVPLPPQTPSRRSCACVWALFPFLSLRRSAPPVLRQSHRPTRQPAGQPAPPEHLPTHVRPRQKISHPCGGVVFSRRFTRRGIACSAARPRGAGRGLWGRAAALYGGPPPAGVVSGAMLVRLISRGWKNDAGGSLSQTQDTAQQVGRP